MSPERRQVVDPSEGGLPRTDLGNGCSESCRSPGPLRRLRCTIATKSFLAVRSYLSAASKHRQQAMDVLHSPFTDGARPPATTGP